MTKTLTEQWYDNTIDRSHHYYVRIKGKEEMNCGGIDFIDIIRPPLFRDQLDKLMKYNDPEVLSAVPSYDEYKELVRKSDKLDKIMYDSATNQCDCQQIVDDNLNRQIERLEKKLAIATKALKEYMTFCRHPAEEALKEMKGVK